MKTKVGLSHEPKRKRPWLVYWWTPPNDESGGQQKRTQAFKYKRDAQFFQSEKQAEVNRGCHRDTSRDVSLGDLLSEFDQARLTGLSHASRENYSNTMGQLREHFGASTLLRRIDRRHAETFISSRKRRDGKNLPLSTWSIARHVMHCRAIFGAAVDWGYIGRNPFELGNGSGASPIRVRPKARPWHHLTPEQFQSLLSVVVSVPQRAAYWLMYGCGLRPGEVYNLTIDRVDLAGRRVRIANRTATDDVPPFTVKSDGQTGEAKERIVPIPESAVPDLTAAVQGAFKAGGFVCLSPERHEAVLRNWRLCKAGEGWAKHRNRPWQNRDMVNNLLRDTKAYLRKVGVELSAPFTLTTFRKSFAQNHADAGTPPRTLARLLGHTDSRVTLQFYNRVTDANERAAAQAMDRMFATPSQARGAS